MNTEPHAADLDATAPGAAPLATADVDPDMPSLEDLDHVAADIQDIEAALERLDKSQSPMCDACQTAFAEAETSERLELLNCTHGPESTTA